MDDLLNDRFRSGSFAGTSGAWRKAGKQCSRVPPPHHPLADEKGYVYYPNVNVVEEMADMISASRSFQINVQIAEAAKTLSQRVLALGQS